MCVQRREGWEGEQGLGDSGVFPLTAGLQPGLVFIRSVTLVGFCSFCLSLCVDLIPGL